MPRLAPRVADGYAQFWSQLGITHELTISLGISPRAFSPEVQLKPILRNLIRVGARRLRGASKRQACDLVHTDPKALLMAGFYEATKRSGEPFPHWHGGIALQPGEEPILRELLWEHIGEDAEDPLPAFQLSRTTRPLVKIHAAQPTFHLTRLQTKSRYISYANKNTHADNVTHWTTADILS
ncbi:MAG: hypothetical protein ACK4UQ_08220 [Brevundimonas sp.]